MSWDGYITSLQSSGHVESAIIIGCDGSIWATSPTLQLQRPEVDALLKGFGLNSSLSQTGIKVNGVKYFYLQSGDDHIQGKKGQGGISVGKSEKCVIIATYNESMQPGGCRNAVENMIAYLKSVGY